MTDEHAVYAGSSLEADARSTYSRGGFGSRCLGILRSMRSSLKGERACDSGPRANCSTMWGGAPMDFNTREGFPVERLEKALMALAEGHGSSMMTISCANPTYEQAGLNPEKYDLLRARGGWTDFFVAMFPAFQAQHQRRPFGTPLNAVPARIAHV
jgi:hypothetical protein